MRSKIRQLEKLLADRRLAGWQPKPFRPVGQLTDAELLDVIRGAYPGFPENPTDEELEAIIAADKQT